MPETLVDFHCHLDLYDDLESAVKEAEEARVYTLAVTTTPKAWARNLEATKRARYVRAALGLHPQIVAERHLEITLWETHLSETRYVGEVGLDASPRYYRSFDLQTQVFERILKQCARYGGKILSVHSVRAVTPVLNLLETHLPPSKGRAVLHWFTGSKAEAHRAAELGCFFSINAAMLLREKSRRLVSTLPRDRLLTETDGPFTRIDGRATRPIDVNTTAAALAELLGVTPDIMGSTLGANLQSLLGSS